VASKTDPRNADERRIALLFDFENIALGLSKGSKKLEVQPILDRILEKGRIVVKRAYADWTRYGADKQELHESGFELIEVPKRRLSGKNSADIRMVVDAMDVVINREHVDTYALISGDSDFSPLVTKLREHDKYVIGIGLRDSSSTLLADNCDEFIFYEDLIKAPAPKRKRGATHEDSDTDTSTEPQRKAEAFYLVVDAVKAFKREGYDSIWASMVKQTIKRKHPSFNEQRHGYDTFSDLIEDAAKHGVLEVKRDEKSGNYLILGLGRRVPSA
jgi:uncharacterized protein (TIGR00288 family)